MSAVDNEMIIFERNRTFLRYLCGPTPADKEEAMQRYSERFPRLGIQAVVVGFQGEAFFDFDDGFDPNNLDDEDD